MNTFQILENELARLEQRHFDRLRAEFRPTAQLLSCINGQVQFFALDKYQSNLLEPLSVVCAVGVNYTQGQPYSGELVHFSASRPSLVVRSTQSRSATGFVIAAYNRNKTAWTTVPALQPPSPMCFYGSNEATTRAGLTSLDAGELTDRFILIITNIFPFITQKKWKDQAGSTHEACEDLIRSYPSETHLDDLFHTLGESIDLWIGHSAILGTKWVWPKFSDFLQRHAIQEWLLSGNINPQSHLWFNKDFRRKQHRLLSWYGPEIA